MYIESNTFNSWDKFFMSMAYLVGKKSKDPSTKIGSVIVGNNNEIISIGYNGLPRNIKDLPNRYKRPLKYNLAIHSEENSIINCTHTGTSCKGCRIYVPLLPCLERCTPRIIQSGITEIIIDKRMTDIELNSKSIKGRKQWLKDEKLIFQLLKEANVTLRCYDGDLLINDSVLVGEREYKLIYR